MKVKAKKIMASLDSSTLPNGYVLSTNSSIEKDTSCGGKINIDFGAYPQSGIYGVAFYDVNSNGKLDSSGTPLPAIKVGLSGGKSTRTDIEGVYFFSGMPPGKYTVNIDINPIPLEYIPLVPFSKEIEISEGVYLRL